MPDPIGLTVLGSWTIEHCDKLRALLRGIGKLGAFKQLTFCHLNTLQEMLDLSGLTVLNSLTIEWCDRLRAMPRGISVLVTLGP